MAARRLLSASAQAVVAATYAAASAAGRGASAIYETLRAALPGEGAGAIRRELDALTGQQIETGAIPAAEPQAAIPVPGRTRQEPGQASTYEYFVSYRPDAGPIAGQWVSGTTSIESDVPLSTADIVQRIRDLNAGSASVPGWSSEYEIPDDADIEVDVYLLSER